MACETASVRLEAPSFAKMDATWVLTVCSEMLSAVRDQLVAEPFGQQIQHLQFAGAEWFGQILREWLRVGQKLGDDAGVVTTSPAFTACTAPSISCGVASHGDGSSNAGAQRGTDQRGIDGIQHQEYGNRQVGECAPIIFICDPRPR